MHAHVDISKYMYINICTYIYIYIYIYAYIYKYMYNMHMLDNIRIQVYKNVQNQIPETFIYMTMDAEHNETTPTIPFDLFS